MKLWIDISCARNLERERRTNRAFCKHCATSVGKVLKTWRLRGTADAS